MKLQAQQAFPLELSETLQHFHNEKVIQTQMITTLDGGWAIAATVLSDTPLPVAELERVSGGFPVQYEIAPVRVPRARPAFPKFGE